MLLCNKYYLFTYLLTRSKLVDCTMGRRLGGEGWLTQVYNTLCYRKIEDLAFYRNVFNPIPAVGGQFDPPCNLFYITQKVLV